MIVLGLTGGIACGKSSVARYLTRCGAKCLNADKLCHRLSKPKHALWQVYQKHYGDKALLPDGTFDRKKIAEIIFGDKEERERLNSETHPILRQAMEQQIEGHRQRGTEILFLDVPLLYEAGWEDMTEAVWVVYADPATQLSRLMRRDKLDERTAQLRLAAQMSAEEKRARADVVIDSSGTWEDTVAQVDAALAAAKKSPVAETKLKSSREVEPSA